MKTDPVKRPFFFYSLILTGCLGSLSIGYQLGIYNTCSSSIANYYDYKTDENKALYEGLITSSITLGGMIGAFYSSSLIKTGRKSAFIIIDVFTIISVFFCYFSGIFALIFSRLLSGVCLGLNSVIVPIFIKEFSPPNITGITGSLHSVFISGGVLLSFFFGFLMPISGSLVEYGVNLWRILFSVPILISLFRIYILMRYFNFETPAYLLKNKREPEAKLVMDNLYSKDYITELIKSINKTDRGMIHYRDLFGPTYINQMRCGILISIFQQLTGITAVIFYSNQLFMEGGDETIAIIFTFMVGVLLTFTAMISGKIMDVFGRRKTMLVGDFFVVVNLGLMIVLKSTNYSFLIKYIILVFIFSFGVSLGPILWVYLTETLPEKGVGLATLVNWASNLLIAFLFPKMIDSFLKFEGTFSIFFAFSTVGLVYMYMNMIETKGRTIMEISKISQYDAVF